MKERKFVSDQLLTSIDVINTLNGGVSEPFLKLNQFQDHREIRMKVPGINDANLKVEIHNNVLNVFYNFNLRSGGLPLGIPKVVYQKPIPYFVDADRISATVDDGFLVVVLPFNSLAEGYHRSITIEN